MVLTHATTTTARHVWTFATSCGMRFASNDADTAAANVEIHTLGHGCAGWLETGEDSRVFATPTEAHGTRPLPLRACEGEIG